MGSRKGFCEGKWAFSVGWSHGQTWTRCYLSLGHHWTRGILAGAGTGELICYKVPSSVKVLRSRNLRQGKQCVST